MRLASLGYLQMPQCHPCGHRQTVRRLVCAEPGLKHELEVQQQKASISVSEAKGNSHPKREHDCHRHVLLKNTAGAI